MSMKGTRKHGIMESSSHGIVGEARLWDAEARWNEKGLRYSEITRE
jgi:hypothetical protein